MPLRSGFGPAHPELEPFLLAEIGDDRTGMPLTVQSALARLDLDPQSEAIRIYEQSRDAAVRNLTDLIEALPEGSWTKLDARELAADLLTRLPHGRRRQAEPVANGPPPRTAPRMTILRLFICAALAALVTYGIWGMPGGTEDYKDLSSLQSGGLALAMAEPVSAAADGRAHAVEGTSAHALVSV